MRISPSVASNISLLYNNKNVATTDWAIIYNQLSVYLVTNAKYKTHTNIHVYTYLYIPVKGI